MTEYQIINWRDIPVQVRVRVGRERHSQLLSERFQAAARRAAYRGRAITGDAYMSAWNSTPWQSHTAPLDEALPVIVATIESDYPPERLLLLIDNKGFKASNHDDS